MNDKELYEIDPRAYRAGIREGIRQAREALANERAQWSPDSELGFDLAEAVIDNI